MTRIVDDLLDLNRVESGRALKLERMPCNLCNPIRNLVHQCQICTDKHRLEVSLSKSTPAELWVDEKRMRQVLENLLRNAVKYFPQGGKIWVRGEMRGENYQVSVEDEGLGMTPEHMARAFDKFYRVDTSDTAVGGLGLGMSIAKLTVEAQGGKIWMESEPGREQKYFLRSRQPPRLEIMEESIYCSNPICWNNPPKGR